MLTSVLTKVRDGGDLDNEDDGCDSSSSSKEEGEVTAEMAERGVGEAGRVVAHSIGIASYPLISSKAVLNRGKKSVPLLVFPKRPAGTPCAQPGLVAVNGWRLAVGNWRLVAVGGGWRQLVVGDWWLVAVGSGWRLVAVGGWRLVAASRWRRLVVGGWWRLVVGGWWRLAVDGSWQLAVGGPLWRSLPTKNFGSLRTALISCECTGGPSVQSRRAKARRRCGAGLGRSTVCWIPPK